MNARLKELRAQYRAVYRNRDDAHEMAALVFASEQAKQQLAALSEQADEHVPHTER
ncbi:hypothetical protein [Microbacterium sp. NPDC057650]|uniref:hypothetical protein n=1 Tax=unclassified Microbacterium TaxID=2609290 RepID=UPI00366D3B3F